VFGIAGGDVTGHGALQLSVAAGALGQADIGHGDHPLRDVIDVTTPYREALPAGVSD